MYSSHKDQTTMHFSPISLTSCRSLKCAALAVSVALLGGCATTSSDTPEEAVSQRVQERWNLLLKKDYEKAYTYLTPAQRAIVTSQGYSGKFGQGAEWVSANLQSVTCDNQERCNAIVQIKTNVMAKGFSGPITTRATEVWVKDEGNWWFHQNL